MIKIITRKRYNELIDRNNDLAMKNIDLTLDKDHLEGEITLYNTQVNHLMGKVEDLTDKLNKAQKKIDKLTGKDKPKEKKKAGRPRKESK